MKINHKVLISITFIILIVGVLFGVREEQRQKQLERCLWTAEYHYNNEKNFTYEQKEISRKDYMDAVEVCQIKFSK